MRKILLYILGTLIVSMYYFPITFSFFPVTNTKNIMALFGFLILGAKALKSRKLSLPFRILILTLLSALVSLAALGTTIYNNTGDMSYASFVITMALWLGASVTVCHVVKLIHGRIEFVHICNYIVAVCVYQCVMAMMINYIPAFQAFVDRWILQGQEFLHDTGRLYGIGASLDTAGGRFAVGIVIIFGLLRNDDEEKWAGRQWLYLVALMVVSVVGNMVARTTTTGLVVGVMYLIITSELWKLAVSNRTLGAISKFFSVLVVIVPVIIFLYNTNEPFHELMRFGFEGVFSIFETGEWNVRSNTALESMVVFPESLKTWIIGDGYFGSPNGDVNYLGDLSIGGFYMGTDIGYLRFIFYFGIIGLVAFSSFIIYSCIICCKECEKYKNTFLCVLLINFIVWLKVATDMFLVFAIFISALYLQSDSDNETTLLDIQ